MRGKFESPAPIAVPPRLTDTAVVVPWAMPFEMSRT